MEAYKRSEELSEEERQEALDSLAEFLLHVESIPPEERVTEHPSLPDGWHGEAV